MSLEKIKKCDIIENNEGTTLAGLIKIVGKCIKQNKD